MKPLRKRSLISFGIRYEIILGLGQAVSGRYQNLVTGDVQIEIVTTARVQTNWPGAHRIEIELLQNFY